MVSSIYAEEARGLFVALGNRLKESAHPDLINAQSIMFDVERGTSSHQSTITAGSNTIDALLLTMKVGGDNQANVVNVIHSAGTHGVEGFAGSAIQLNLLREMILQSTEEQSSTEKPYVRKILLIHAVNPFGSKCPRLECLSCTPCQLLFCTDTQNRNYSVRHHR